LHTAQYKETTKNWKKDSGESINNFKSKTKKKNKLLPRIMLQFLNLPFPPPNPPHTQNLKTPQKQRTGSQHKMTSTTTAKKERWEKQKNNDQILFRKVSLLLSQTEMTESPKTQQRRVHIEVGVDNECVTTSYYNSGGTRRQKLLPLALIIDSTTATTTTQCRIMSSHKSENQTTLMLLLSSSSSCMS
jgi:hypothetical protein